MLARYILTYNQILFLAAILDFWVTSRTELFSTPLGVSMPILVFVSSYARFPSQLSHYYSRYYGAQMVKIQAANCICNSRLVTVSG